MNSIESILDASTLAALRAAERGTCEMLAPEVLCIEGIGERPTRPLTSGQLDEITKLLLDAGSWQFGEFKGLPRDILCFWLAGPAGEVAVAICFTHSRWTIVGPSGSRVGSFASVREKLVALMHDVFRETAPWPNRELGKSKLAVLNLIKTAFAGVTLGEGIGLLEANSIDDHASDAERAEMRAQDERRNWTAIPFAELDRCNPALTYTDAKGMRFLLPAFLVGHLQGALKSCDMLIQVTHPFDWAQFALLNKDQHQAVREFIETYRADLNYACELDWLDAALSGYWAESTEGEQQ